MWVTVSWKSYIIFDLITFIECLLCQASPCTHSTGGQVGGVFLVFADEKILCSLLTYSSSSKIVCGCTWLCFLDQYLIFTFWKQVFWLITSMYQLAITCHWLIGMLLELVLRETRFLLRFWEQNKSKGDHLGNPQIILGYFPEHFGRCTTITGKDIIGNGRWLDCSWHGIKYHWKCTVGSHSFFSSLLFL